MWAFPQRGVGGPAPGTVRLDRDLDCGWRTVHADNHGGARLAGAVEGWRTVAGVERPVGELAVFNAVNQRDLRISGIDGDGIDRAECADVTRCVNCRNGDVQRAIRLRGQGQRPFAVNHYHASKLDTVVVDDHRFTRHTGSADGWRGIGSKTAIRLTGDGANHRGIRCEGIDGDGDPRRRVRDVTRLVGGGSGKFVTALVNGAFRTPAPVTVAVYRDRTHGGWRAAINAVVNGNHVIRRAGATQYRTRIVDGFAIGHRAGYLADAVGNHRDRWRSRCVGVDGDGHRLGRGAFVARAVLVGDGQGNVIGAVGQVGGWRPAPVAVAVHHGVTDFVGAVVNRHRIARITGTAQRRCGITGGFPRVQRRRC